MWKRDASNMQMSSPLTQLVVVSYSSFSNIQTPSAILNHREHSHRNVLNHWVFLSFLNVQYPSCWATLLSCFIVRYPWISCSKMHPVNSYLKTLNQ